MDTWWITDGRMDGQIERYMDDVCMLGSTDGQRDGYVDGLMSGYVDGWMDR